MKLWMIFAMLLMFANQAWGRVEVTCFQQDCFKYGWEIHFVDNRQTKYLYCTEDDCLNLGWVVESNYGEEAEAICKAGGCFVEGWELYNSRTNRMISESICHKSFDGDTDCLRYGWSTYGANRSPVRTQCLRDDCKKYGWDTKAPGFVPQRVRCRAGGCFTEGWTEL